MEEEKKGKDFLNTQNMERHKIPLQFKKKENGGGL